MRILEELHASGRTIVLITHDPLVASHAGRQVHTLDGRIVDGRSAA
jgi:ABC-type lipoprotein export system ATPase subunit